MKMPNTRSLSATLDAVNEAAFYDRPLPRPARGATAEWIASRQGRPGSYAGLFAPTARDFRDGIRFFTGERFATHAGVAHCLGEEAGRALILLGVKSPAVRSALTAANDAMASRLADARRREAGAGRPFRGQYCCGRCSVALWRHLAAGGLTGIGPERWLAAGVKGLRTERDGRGRWRRFPFHFALLALTEIDLPGAVAEMRYAAPALQRSLARSGASDVYARRRRDLAERVLARC